MVGQVTGKAVLEELAAVAFARTADYYGPDWTPDPASAGAALASVEKTSSGVKLRFYDKLKALELLGKHFGLFSGVAFDECSTKQGILEAFLREDDHGISEPQCQTEAGSELVESESLSGS